MAVITPTNTPTSMDPLYYIYSVSVSINPIDQKPIGQSLAGPPVQTHTQILIIKNNIMFRYKVIENYNTHF